MVRTKLTGRKDTGGANPRRNLAIKLKQHKESAAAAEASKVKFSASASEPEGCEDPQLPKIPFLRLVREIAQDISPDACFTPASLHALRAAASVYLINMFENANLCCLHAGRVTLMKKDMDLSRRLCGMADPNSK